MITKISNILALMGFLLISICSAEKKIVCYYESSASLSGIQPEDFDANLCTHINYAYAIVIKNGSIIPRDLDLDINKKLYQRISDMKKINKKLKVLLSIGGDDYKQARLFSSTAADPIKKKNFFTTSNELLTKYNMDGLDIAWDMPEAEDKLNYISFLKEIKENFKNKEWLLSVAARSHSAPGYDIPLMNQYLDYINLKTYRYYGPWSQHAGFNSPLYASRVDHDWETNLNVNASFTLWINSGASPNKLIIGIGFHGSSFSLYDPNKHKIHAVVTDSGVDDGAPSYATICSKYKNWTRVWDDDQKVPYKHHGKQWIGYDDEESIGLKIQYIKQKNAGGAMIWSIDRDDVKGTCGTKQALLKKVQEVKF